MTINGDGIVMRKMDILYLNQITHIIRNCYALKMLKNKGTQTNQSCHFFYIFPTFRKKAGNGINVMTVDIS